MQTGKKNVVKIPCNSTVKDYTVATLKRLGLDAGPGKVYNQLLSGEGFMPKSSREVNKLAKVLLKKIPLFAPSLPLTAADREKYRKFNEKWSESIKQMIAKFEPVYLQDEVNKVLERRKYPQRCQRIHLVWCLSLKGEAHMTPAKVADAIIEYDGTDWKHVLPLKNDTYYHVRLINNTDEEKKKFLNSVEFIYSLKGTIADPSLAEKLQNDIGVLTEFEGWGKELESYRYEERYEECVGRLLTAPVKSKKKNPVKKSPKSAAPKANALGDVTLTPAVSTEQQKMYKQLSCDAEEPDKDVAPQKELTINNSYQGYAIERATPSKTDLMEEELILKTNYKKIHEYLNDITKYDLTGRSRVTEAERDIKAFCCLPDFEEKFEEIRRMINSGTVKYPGGFAVSKIKEMLGGMFTGWPTTDSGTAHVNL